MDLFSAEFNQNPFRDSNRSSRVRECWGGGLSELDAEGSQHGCLVEVSTIEEQGEIVVTEASVALPYVEETGAESACLLSTGPGPSFHR
ncbi:MAG: hypothetical protein ABJA82_11180, partial [Myxococcales bacterium]